MRESDYNESGLQGGVTGLCLTDMISKVYRKTIDDMEKIEDEEGKFWHEQVIEALIRHGAS